jgi:hypothetical protein
MLQYTSATLKQLEARQLAPHIYWTTALARKALTATQVSAAASQAKAARSSPYCIVQMNQAIVINGESGSGKTVSTSHIIDCLCNDASWPSTCAKSVLLSPRLRHSGALFESLGNACTVRNNNSRS